MSDDNLLREIQEDYKKAQTKPKKKRKTQAEMELERIDRIRTIKRNILIVFVLVATAVTGVAYAAERYVDWRAEHEWQFPAKWIGFVRKIELQIISPVSGETQQPLTEDEVIDQHHLAPVLHSIYMLESTEGENDSCKDEGKFNGYGYAQNGSMWKCYDSFDEVTERVNMWLEDRLATNGNNLTEAICYYNTGIEWQDYCGDYSANFWSVLSNYF